MSSTRENLIAVLTLITYSSGKFTANENLHRHKSAIFVHTRMKKGKNKKHQIIVSNVLNKIFK